MTLRDGTYTYTNPRHPAIFIVGAGMVTALVEDGKRFNAHDGAEPLATALVQHLFDNGVLVYSVDTPVIAETTLPDGEYSSSDAFHNSLAKMSLTVEDGKAIRTTVNGFAIDHDSEQVESGTAAVRHLIDRGIAVFTPAVETNAKTSTVTLKDGVYTNRSQPDEKFTVVDGRVNEYHHFDHSHDSSTINVAGMTALLQEKVGEGLADFEPAEFTTA